MNSSCHVCIVRIIDLLSDPAPIELSYRILEKYSDNLASPVGLPCFLSVNKNFPVTGGQKDRGWRLSKERISKLTRLQCSLASLTYYITETALTVEAEKRGKIP